MHADMHRVEPIAAAELARRLQQVRALSMALAEPLSEADAQVQSMPDTSPTKWHLAHTTWFWETFLLREHAPGYRLWREDCPFLFNSYYEAEGARIARFARGLLSRPSLPEVLEWRAAVTEAMARSLTSRKVQEPTLSTAGVRPPRAVAA